MKCNEFIRWLANKGVEFQPGKGDHLKAFYKGLQTVVPSHGSKEIKTGTMHAILRQLGLKDEFRKDH
jgi:mRNA interferase HicA